MLTTCPQRLSNFSISEGKARPFPDSPVFLLKRMIRLTVFSLQAKSKPALLIAAACGESADNTPVVPKSSCLAGSCDDKQEVTVSSAKGDFAGVQPAAAT